MRQQLLLEDLYSAYEKEVADVAFHCRKGCATCCTRTVNITTSEGKRILQYLKDHHRSLPDLESVPNIPVPPCTTNHAASLCLDHRLMPEGKDSPWNLLPCLFLKNDACTIYPVRPFACRSFGSLSCCVEQGTAKVPEWFVTLNLFVMQIVEDLDREGYWGNMFEVLLSLVDGDRKSKLLKTETIPGFLVPEDDRMRVISFLAGLRTIARDSPQIKKVLDLLGRSITGR